jgi:apolipoprotein N-acyltransferase
MLKRWYSERIAVRFKDAFYFSFCILLVLLLAAYVALWFLHVACCMFSCYRCTFPVACRMCCACCWGLTEWYQMAGKLGRGVSRGRGWRMGFTQILPGLKPLVYVIPCNRTRP